MKEFLKGLWGLFVFVMLLAGIFARCEADRIKQQRANEWRNLRTDYPPSKQSATPQFRPYLSDYPKNPAWQQWDQYKLPARTIKRPRGTEVAPMPRARLVVAPAPLVPTSSPSLEGHMNLSSRESDRRME